MDTKHYCVWLNGKKNHNICNKNVKPNCVMLLITKALDVAFVPSCNRHVKNVSLSILYQNNQSFKFCHNFTICCCWKRKRIHVHIYTTVSTILVTLRRDEILFCHMKLFVSLILFSWYEKTWPLYFKY